jgi:hypothetical protein
VGVSKTHIYEIYNLTKDQSIALTNLGKDTSIVIKITDKVAVVVLMDREDYIIEAERQRSDQNFYIESLEDLTEKHCQMRSLIKYTNIYYQSNLRLPFQPL